MQIIENLNSLLGVAAVTGLLSIYYLFSLLLNIKKIKFFGSLGKLFTLLFFTCLSGFLSLLILGTQGYQALTKELSVATVKITPSGKEDLGIWRFKSFVKS